jgi:hypothetical protein
VLGGWPRLVVAAAQLRDRHRWGVCVCTLEGESRLCAFRPTAPAPGEGPSPVRGVWNGIGLTLTLPTGSSAAATDVDLPPGRYRISALADTPGAADRPETRLELRAHGVTLGAALLPRPTGETPIRIAGVVDHPGGRMQIEVAAQRLSPSAMFIDVAVPWISDIQVESQSR